ncbi:MAG: ABC transporter permease subunit [Peptococcaceae bacterium]|nr:ABC transporter permease subunit [Peptococcaceae bacterium]
MNKNRRAKNIWLLFVSGYLLLPLLLTVVYSFVGEWTSILPTGWTTQYYADLFKDGKLLMGALRGLAISVLPILISGSVVILALYYALLYNPRVERIIQTLCMAPYTIQGIILATSALSLYAGLPGPLGNRLVLLTCVYCIGILPFIYQGIRNGLRTVNLHQIIDAAQILGAGRLYAFVRLVLPSMISGVLASGLLAMASIFGDYAIIRIIAANHWPTAQFYLYNSRTLSIQTSSAIVMLLVIITMTISASVLFLSGSRKSRRIPAEKESH